MYFILFYFLLFSFVLFLLYFSLLFSALYDLSNHSKICVAFLIFIFFIYFSFTIFSMLHIDVVCVFFFCHANHMYSIPFRCCFFFPIQYIRGTEILFVYLHSLRLVSVFSCLLLLSSAWHRRRLSAPPRPALQPSTICYLVSSSRFRLVFGVFFFFCVCLPDAPRFSLLPFVRGCV